MRRVRRSLGIDLSPLRTSRDFRLVFAGAGVSSIGSYLTYVSIPYQVYVLTHGGPGTATQLVSIYGYQTFFQFQQYGYAAALLIMVALVVIAAAGLAVGLMRRRRT